MGWFDRTEARVRRLATHAHAPWYLGGISFAEASFFLIPPDVLLAPMAWSAPKRAGYYALLTTIASVLGGLFGYAIGWFAIDAILPLLERWQWLGAYHKAQALFQTHGFVAVLLAGFTPIPFKIFTIAAGATQLNVALFVAAAVLGRGARFFMVAYLSAFAGGPMKQTIHRYANWLVPLGVVLLAGLYWMLKHAH